VESLETVFSALASEDWEDGGVFSGCRPRPFEVLLAAAFESPPDDADACEFVGCGARPVPFERSFRSGAMFGDAFPRVVVCAGADAGVFSVCRPRTVEALFPVEFCDVGKDD